jgi:hypothetical protein
VYRTDIQPNAPVVAGDGEAGRVTHIIVEPRSGEVSELVIERAGREWLVPAGLVESTDGGTVRLRGRGAEVLRTPFDLEEFRTANRRPAGLPRASDTLDEAPIGAARTDASGEGYTQPPARRTGNPLVDAVRRELASQLGADGVIRIPLRREVVTVEKRWFVAEEVDITRHAVQETEQFADTVRREEAVVEEEGRVRRGRAQP